MDGARRKGLQRASLSIPEAIGEEELLHPRGRERVGVEISAVGQAFDAPRVPPGKKSPWKTDRRRAALRDDLAWPEKAEDRPAATKCGAELSLENLDSVAT